MSKQTDFGTRFRRSMAAISPAQILTEYYFRINPSRHSNVQISGGDIWIKGDCVARVEIGSNGQFRVVFLGPTRSKQLWPACGSEAVEHCSDCTPWFPYEDGLFLAELIDSRIQLLLQCPVPQSPDPSSQLSMSPA